MEQVKHPVEWAKGLKKTRQRCLVLAQLEEADTPVSAAQIDGALRQQGDRLWLSTIYRILDSFVAHGMVRKTDVQESGTALYETETGRHRHYAVCVCCRKIIPLEGCPLANNAFHLEDKGFLVLEHRLQMFGYCSGCRSSGVVP